MKCYAVALAISYKNNNMSWYFNKNYQKVIICLDVFAKVSDLYEFSKVVFKKHKFGRENLGRQYKHNII
jgi:hypothetical protein